MSTKNLSHSVIEGGRYKGNKGDRRQSHRDLRAAEHNYLVDVMADVESFYDFDIAPKQRVGKSFKDKLGPMYRWLNDQIGKPWDEVYSAIKEKFDIRTTAGRHIVFDHLLRSVEITPDVVTKSYVNEDGSSHYKNDFYVSEDGFLCKRKYIPRNYSGYHYRDKYDTNKLATWLNGKVIGKIGNQFFWFVPTIKGKKHHGRLCEVKTQWTNSYSYQGGGLRYLYLWTKTIYDADNKPIGHEPVWQDYTPTFRQDKRLAGKDLEFWNNIPEYYRLEIIKKSPTYFPED